MKNDDITTFLELKEKIMFAIHLIRNVEFKRGKNAECKSKYSPNSSEGLAFRSRDNELLRLIHDDERNIEILLENYFKHK